MANSAATGRKNLENTSTELKEVGDADLLESRIRYLLTCDECCIPALAMISEIALLREHKAETPHSRKHMWQTLANCHLHEDIPIPEFHSKIIPQMRKEYRDWLANTSRHKSLQHMQKLQSRTNDDPQSSRYQPAIHKP